jgi:FMN phosphatase YigB (HAD superfamily)
MIGDNVEADILGAERVGLPAILVRKTHPAARYVAADLLDLPSLLTPN